ncbi:MAG: hypothetical protein KF718_21265 [Polyangiaceae bacterium]|nr:hypothetical protein [Polyangiaceae bacterium]
MDAKLSHGMRCTLRLTRVADAHVEYLLELTTPDDSVTASLELQLGDGAVTGLEQLPNTARAWINSLLRTEWRSRQLSPAPPWPRRITRWRRERGSG